VVGLLTDLRMDILNPDSPLVILDPILINLARRHIVVAPQQLPEFLPLPPNIDQPVTRNHEDLTDIGRAARMGMNAALSKSNRFFHLYTKSGSCKPERSLGAFDIVTILHPFMKTLKFMNTINASSDGYNADTDDTWVDLHKNRIRQYYIDLMIKVIIHNNQQAVKVVQPQPPAAAVNNSPVLAKRQRGAADIQPASKKRVLAMKKNSYMDVESDGDQDAVPEAPLLSPLEQATTEFAYYMTKKTPSALQILLTKPEGLIQYWQTTGKKYFPVLSVVAMAQLGTPPGSGVLENDFSTFANLVTRHRSRLEPSIIEMILFCKLNYKLIPDVIPAISAESIKNHIPIRLRDPDMQAELQQMLVDPHANDSESDVDDNDN
jgi:hAT family C-terminal dimerisation region